MNNRSSHQRVFARGFTLVEVMTVVVIIVLLMGIGLAIGPDIIAMGEEKATLQTIRVLESINEEYRARTGQSISAANMQDFVRQAMAVPELAAMLATIKPDYLGGSVEENNLHVKDAWGSNLIYVTQALVDNDSKDRYREHDSPYILSYGPDGSLGRYSYLRGDLRYGRELRTASRQAADNIYSFEVD